MAQTAKTPESKTSESKLGARIREPSMEEILASIRRIIADEDTYASSHVSASSHASTKAEKVGAKLEANPEAELDAKSMTPAPTTEERWERSHSAPPAAARWREYESLSVSAEPTDSAAKSSTLDFTDSVTGPAAKSSTPEPLSEPTEPKTAAAPRSHFADRESEAGFEQAGDRMPMPSLAGGALGGRDPLLSEETTAAVDSAFNALTQTVLVQNARTLEDLVREMLRPLLKSWLDDNLPSLVERLVRAEIERVSRGRPS
jgi:cell pole-organizing protein PopZ